MSNNANYSFYAIPAMWTVSIVPHLWAISTHDKHRAPGTKAWNNANPQETRNHLKDAKMSPVIQGRVMRAEAAQNNGFVNLPLFAAAIIAGNCAGLPASTMNTFAAVYIASRIAFNLAYIYISDGTLAYLRSAIYFGGVFYNLHLFIKAGDVLTKRSA